MSTHLQVAWLANKQQLTWEPASCLPQSLIDEYECGQYTQRIITTTDASYGAINHSLAIEKHDLTHPPQTKSLKTTMSATEPGYDTLGLVKVHLPVSKSIPNNTELFPLAYYLTPPHWIWRVIQ